jgi:hypothetical protein
MRNRTFATLMLLLAPAVVSAQAKVRGEKKADWNEINKSSTQTGLQLSNRDIESISPIRLLLDKRKDLSLTDEQVKRVKEVEAKVAEKNDGFFKAIDSLRNEMKPSSRASEEDGARKMMARNGVMSVLAEIRANYDGALTEAMAPLDEGQRKSASSMIEKQSAEATDMLREKLGGRRPDGDDAAAAAGGSGRRGRPATAL